MLKSSLLNQEKFWTIVKALAGLKEEKSILSFCDEFEISESQLNSYLLFMQEVGFRFESKNEMLTPLTPDKIISLQFNLLEWIQFQAHFPALSTCKAKPYHEDVKMKLIELEEKYKEHDLFNPLQALEEIFKNQMPALAVEGSNPTQQILMFLEESIIDRKSVVVNYQDKELKIYPLKIVYFEGGLNLIGENILDGMLTNLKLEKISSAHEVSSHYQPVFSPGEVEGFVSSLKAMHEKVVRLVLKIYEHENFGIHLNQVYFHNPCLFTNPEGDYIWAATLEPSPAVFEWLCDLGQYVEILDPTSFKREFLKYCEDKLKKIA